MTDHPLLGDDSLEKRFTDIDAAIPESVIAKPSGERSHRVPLGADETVPACATKRRDDDWRIVDVEAAERSRLRPCRRCFRPILEHLARDPESPVTFRGAAGVEDGQLQADGGGERFEPEPAPGYDPDPPRLTSLPATVLVSSGCQTMHAPSERGPFCGARGDYRSVERVAVETHFDACRDCFDLDESAEQ